MIKSMSMSVKLRLEMLWWAFTLVLTLVLVLPITTQIPQYPFLGINILYIITFVTITRHLFLLQHTFIAPFQRVRLALIFLMIPFIFYQIQELNYFQITLDEQGLDFFVSHLPYEDRGSMMRYLYNQMVFFAAGSIIASFLFPFRMVLSIWRYRNRGGKV